ncbi:MAG TPA: excinuclease ABC subunit C [Acidobacteriaceae bacterium]|jgi:excinuclease UvrABC nuclease subunit|nr:excinuclease ABC subunit C [Acidobacteriaceae bacterium]
MGSGFSAARILAVGAEFEFERRVEFRPERAEEILREVPAAPGVVCLRGERETDQPYLTRVADMRRRVRRLLGEPEPVSEAVVFSKRLNLRERVRWIEWTRTGSEFESNVLLYSAARAIFGAEEARRRLHLHAPYVLRVTMTHEHPRVYATNRLGRKMLGEAVGPFPSRAVAERYCDAMLDLFKLRRCCEDLEVSPQHPGCAYGEMKMCMEPCKAACTREEYAAEARRVRDFLWTNGASMLAEVAARREAASEAMDFEQAAAQHKMWEKVHAAAGLVDELVGPLAELRALIVQRAAPVEGEAVQETAAVFVFEKGRICGPERLATLGVRAVREQTAVGSSLFAQPLMLEAIPLDHPSEQAPTPANKFAGDPDARRGPREETSESAQPASESASRQVSGMLSPEERAKGVVARLEERAAENEEPEAAERGDFLAILRRWYYRPEKQRAGAVLLPNRDGGWPMRRLLNAAAREALGRPREMAPVDRDSAREAAKEMKTRVLHEGREGVERVVPVLPKRARRTSVTPGDVAPDK